MKVLNAGKGAKGTILTRYIKPAQPIPDGERKTHRSNVILLEMFDQNGKKSYRFKFPQADDSQPLMYASARFVKVEEEGEPSLFFEKSKAKTKFVEPKIPWKDSIAKEKLYRDVMEGKIPLDAKEKGNNSMTLKDIYAMHPEYAEYDYQKFSGRLRYIRIAIRDLRRRADEDEEAFNKFAGNNEVSLYSYKGYIQWQGSVSQRLLLEDIAAGKLEEYRGNKKGLYLSRPEFYNEFPLEVFRDKVDQEVGTAKYLHTVKVKGKQYKSS